MKHKLPHGGPRIIKRNWTRKTTFNVTFDHHHLCKYRIRILIWLAIAATAAAAGY